MTPSVHKPTATKRLPLRRGAARPPYSSLAAQGEPMVWLTGGGLAAALAMIVCLLVYLVAEGARSFWPGELWQVTLVDGQKYLGEATRSEWYLLEEGAIAALPPPLATAARQARDQAPDGLAHRTLYRTELTSNHFDWIDDFAVAKTERPAWAVTIERIENGPFYGIPHAIILDGETAVTTTGLEGSELEKAERRIWEEFTAHHGEAVARRKTIEAKRKQEIGRENARLEAARLAMVEAKLDFGPQSSQYLQAAERHQQVDTEVQQQITRISEEIVRLEEENARDRLLVRTVRGEEVSIPLGQIVRLYPANQLGFFGKLGVYTSRWWEFVTADPREANSEGGVWPAIVGTVIMTMIMAVAVVPFGVLAALYLREYARPGPTISLVRIAINNLAGVPSIVFGVFGLGFFCYIVGAGIDQFFFAARVSEGNPTFGKGALVWASLTLALLTLPVVIVATEEALAAVPNSMREGSYGCGASKWQTIWRIVLPHAMPGIMTGMILAMARGAGEVAPLMLVGALKVVPDLPIDATFPFLHPGRSFMHLGFHIYDLGFQSQNSEAAKRLVFTTTLLLISLIAVLNLMAVWLRGRLRKRFASGQF